MVRPGTVAGLSVSSNAICTLDDIDRMSCSDLASSVAVTTTEDACAFDLDDGRTCVVTRSRELRIDGSIQPLRDVVDVDCRGPCAVSGGRAVCYASIPFDRAWTDAVAHGWYAARIDGAVTSVAATHTAACAISDDGRLWCWGQHADPAFVADAVPMAPLTEVDLPRPARDIALGTGFGCALLVDRTVACWGGNEQGQLGRGHTRADPQSGLVAGLVDVEAVAAAGAHACALTHDGAVHCWGGVSDTRSSLRDGTPMRLPALDGASELTIGDQAICARVGVGVSCVGVRGDEIASTVRPDAVLSISGGDTCRGSASGWQCDFLGTVVVDEPDGVLEIDASLAEAWSCATTRDAVRCATAEQTLTERRVGTVVTRPRPRSLSLGRVHGCVLDSRGAAHCFGRGAAAPDCSDPPLREDPICGRGVLDQLVHPPRGLPALAMVVAARSHTCGLDRVGRVACWGALEDGGAPEAPVTIELGGAAAALARSTEDVCALLRDGTVRCWSRLERRGTAVPGLSAIDRVWGGAAGFCARNTAGAVWCWAGAQAIESRVRPRPFVVVPP